MVICSVHGCRKHAVLTWSRTATDTEASADLARLQASADEAVAISRTNARLHVADLQGMLQRLEGWTDPDAATTRMRIQQDIDAAQAAVDTIGDAPRIVPLPNPTVPLYGCPDHAPDLESAALVHPADCISDGPCSCEVTS